MDQPELLQNKVTAFIMHLAGGVFAVLVILGALVEPWLPLWMAVPLAALSLYFFSFRMGRGGVWVSEAGIRVRNPFTSTGWIPWAEVSGASLQDRFPWCASVRFRDGWTLTIVMLDRPTPLGESLETSTRDAVAKINSRVAL